MSSFILSTEEAIKDEVATCGPSKFTGDFCKLSGNSSDSCLPMMHFIIVFNQENMLDDRSPYKKKGSFSAEELDDEDLADVKMVPIRFTLSFFS